MGVLVVSCPECGKEMIEYSGEQVGEGEDDYVTLFHHPDEEESDCDMVLELRESEFESHGVWNYTGDDWPEGEFKKTPGGFRFIPANESSDEQTP